MRAGGMRRDIEALAVAAESLRVAPRPGNGAAHLLVHREQIAARLLDVDEVEDEAMRTGANERFGLQVIIRPLVAPPGAAVNKDVDRRTPSFSSPACGGR